MNPSTALKCILPLSGLLLTHCMTDTSREAEETAGSPVPAVAARLQSQHMFNPAQYSLMSKGDFDGNNTKDLYWISAAGRVDLRLGNARTSAPFATPLDYIVMPGNFGDLSDGSYIVGQYNGDRFADLFFIKSDGTLHVRYAAYHNGQLTYEDQVDFPGNPANTWAGGKFLAGDIDGDGNTDLYYIRNGGGLTVYRNNGGVFSEQFNYVDGSFGSWTGGKYYIGDMNGDRSSDLFFIGNGGDVHVRVASGGYHLTSTQYKLLNAGAFGNLSQGQYHLADLQNDGFADILYIGNYGDVHVRWGNGRTIMNYGEYRPLISAGQFWSIYQGQYQVGDWNGDGWSDLFFIGNSGYVSVRLPTGPGPLCPPN
jgi:hypothetical protein